MKKFYFFLVALVLGVMSASAIDYYLIGGFNGWTTKDAKCKFTAQPDGTYVLDYIGNLTSGFKVNDGTWSNDAANFGSSGPALEIGVPYSYGVGGSTGNITMSGAIDNPHIVLNTAAGTLTITGQVADVKTTYCIWGNLPDASLDWAAIDMEEMGNDVWKATGVNVNATSDFGFRQLGNGAQTDWVFGSGNTAITSAGIYNCVFESKVAAGSNFSIAPGTWDLTLDVKAMTLKVEGQNGPGSLSPATLYVLGDFPGDATTHWNPAYGVALEKNGDVFTGEIEIETAYENTHGFFSLCTKLGTASDDWNVGTRYGATADGVEVVSGESYAFEKAAEPYSWKVLPGLYEITVDFTTNTIELKGESNGILDAEIEDADVAPVYYNLQGVRVAEPANGLYIVVRGEKVTKELVK